jgi:hypothetical protein
VAHYQQSQPARNTLPLWRIDEESMTLISGAQSGEDAVVLIE